MLNKSKGIRTPIGSGWVVFSFLKFDRFKEEESHFPIHLMGYILVILHDYCVDKCEYKIYNKRRGDRVKVKKEGRIQLRIDEEVKRKAEQVLAEKHKKTLSEYLREKIEEVLK